MSALVPYNYHGSHKRKRNHYYDQRFMGQTSFIPRPFPTQSYYPPYFFQNGGYPQMGYNQFGRNNMMVDLMSFNRANEQYRYAQYIRNMNMMQNQNWKREASAMPPPRKNGTWYETSGNLYYYEQEIRYLPYPVFVGPGGVSPGYGGNLRPGYPTVPGSIGGLTTLIAPAGPGVNLPPKIRVIFMPTGFPSLQQPCTGALGMPPFLFNRISQPLCSLPLPPPLPQLCSLPLTPNVQQMVARQYANPVAVFPFTPNWSMAPPMTTNYPQIVSQQPQQSMLPTSALNPPYPYTPQSYIPPTLLPSNMPMLPSNTTYSPFSSDATGLQASYWNNGYPSTCRACIPAPPSLNVPVTGHCWVQHCSACHHVPADATNPNSRLNNGRSTPLLLHPTVRQTAYNPPIEQQQQQHYPYINTSVTEKPWLHKMPPLPAGAVVISEGYVPRNDIVNASHFSQKFPIQNPRVMNSATRSLILGTTCSINQNQTNKTKLERKERKKQKADKSQSKIKSNNTTPVSHAVTPVVRRASTSSSASSSSSSCSLCKVARAKKQVELDADSHKDEQQNQTSSQSMAAAEARNVNIRYDYQAPDLDSVYHTNSDLRSSDADSLPISNPTASPKYLQVTVHYRDALLSPLSIDSIEKDDQKSNHTSSPVLSQSERPVKKIIVIRQFRTNSPSTISTVSSNRSFRVLDKDFDSMSTTSTIKEDPIKENGDNISETF